MATQRHYRAPCPGCGAPVEFHSAQSTHAVCAYCQSTVVRSGEVLSRLGKMAEVFDDHSPLQLQASGRITLDGVDTSRMDRGELRRQFGMVLQDAWLFGGTIRENIAYGRPDATDDEIRGHAVLA